MTRRRVHPIAVLGPTPQAAIDAAKAAQPDTSPADLERLMAWRAVDSVGRTFYGVSQDDAKSRHALYYGVHP